MSVKIQINSLEALERLLGGDTTLEVEIRQSVVQQFAKAHLKPFENIVSNVGAEMKQAHDKAMKSAIEQAIGTEQISYGRHSGVYDLNPNLRARLDLEIRALLQSHVTLNMNAKSAEFEAQLKAKHAKYDSLIETRLKEFETRLNVHFETAVQDGIFKQKVNDEVKRRLASLITE